MGIRVARRVRAVAVACTVVGALAAAPTSQAALLNVNTSGSLSTTLSTTTNTTTNLVGGVVGGALTTVGGVVCPTLTQLTQTLSQTPLLGDGLGAIGAGVTSLVCASGLLEYKVITRFKRPDGTYLTRTFSATIGVPTPLNVDDDALNDLTATLSLTGLNSIGLTVNRDALKPTANLPVSVEAVIGDGTTKVLGRRYLAFGYDATADQAPGGFTLDTPLDTITRPGGDFRINLSQTSRRNRIKVTAGIFDGTPTSRTNPTEASIDYGASPDTASIVARAGSDFSATLTTNRPGPTGIFARVVDNDRIDRVDAQVNDMPGSLSVSENSQSGTTATYSASARVASIDATVQRTVGSTLTQKTRLTLNDVPTGLSASLSGNQVNVATSGGPLGLARIGQANGEPKFLPDTEPAYVYSDDNGTLKSISAKIPGLESATAQLGSAPTVSARIASTPLLARLVDPQRSIDARVLNLPSHFDLGFDPTGGSVSYNGYGTGIAKITLDGSAVASAPFFGRATRLKGSIEGIPASLGLSFKPDATAALKVVASNPIAKIELAAANRPIDFTAGGDLPAGTTQGAKYTDTTSTYALGARLLGLRSISASTAANKVVLSAQTAGGPFALDVATDDLTGTAQVLDLPSNLDATLDLPNGRLSVDGHGQGIGRITADVHGTTPLFGRATDVHANVEGIPSVLTVDIAQGGDGASIVANDPIGLVELVAANHVPNGSDLPAGGEQGAKFVDLAGGEYTIGARIRNLKKLAASFASGQPITVSTQTEGGPFGLRVDTDALHATARIEDLPAQLDASVDLAQGKLTVDGHGQTIHRVTLDVSSADALFGRANAVHALVEDIPAAVTLDLAQSGTGVRIEASDPIGRIEVVASNHTIGDPSLLLPPDDEQGARYTDTTSDFLVSARVKELRKVVADLSGTVSLEAHTAGGPFSVHAITQTLTADAQLRDLPKDVTASFDPAGGAFTYHGRNGDTPAGIGLVTVDVAGSGALFDRANRVHARIEDLAPDVEFSIDPDGPTAHVDTSAPISKLEFLATDIPDGDPVPEIPAGEQGAILQDKTGQPFVLTARLLDLQEIDFSLGGSSIGLHSKLRQTPFGATIRTDDLDVDARIEDLPSETNLSFDVDSGQVTFDSSSGVDLITLAAHSSQALFGRATDVSARIEQVPHFFQLGLGASGGTAHMEASDPIGKVEVSATEGPAVTLPAPLDVETNQGAVFHDNSATPFVLAARVLALKSLDVGIGDEVTLQAETAGGPFYVDADTDSFGAKASILDLPPKASLTTDLANGAITFEGFESDGTTHKGIDDLAIDARLATPILGGADRVKAHVVKLPGHVTLGFSQTDGHAALSTDSPIELIELKGWSSANAEPGYPVDQGVVLHSKPGQDFILAARVRDLSTLDVAFGAGAPVTLQTKTAGGVFTADIETDTLEAQATIDQLPTELLLTLDLDGGHVSYEGSAPIDLISASIHNDQPVFLGATDFEATLQQVPQQFTIDLPQGDDGAVGSTIALHADHPIGQIDLRAHSANRSYPTIAAGDAGAILDSTGGEMDMALRVFQLSTLSVDLDPITLEADMAAGHKFTVDATLDQDSSPDPLVVKATIDQLPSHVSLGLGDNVVNDEVHGSKLTLNGSAPIDFVSLETQGLALLEGADNVKAEIEKLPQKLTVTLPDTGELAHITAQDADDNPSSIGQLRLAAASGTATLPADTYDRATDTASGDDQLTFDSVPGDVDVQVRLSDLQELGLNLDPISLSSTFAHGNVRKLDVDATIANKDDDGNPTGTNANVKATVDKLPQQLTLGLGDAPAAGGGGTQVTWAASSPISEISLDATGVALLEGADQLHADIKGVPAAFNVALPDTTANPNAPLAALAVGGATLGTSGGPRIDELRLAAGSGSLPASGGNDKFNYSQLTSDLNVGIKLTNVKGLSVQLTPKVNLAIDQEDALNGGTKPIDIGATLPNDTGPNTTINGTLNKPSFHTEVGVTLPATSTDATKLNLVNGTPAQPRAMSSFSLNATNLGSIPSASFTLTNIARLLDVCMITGNACEPLDKLPAILPDYVKSTTTSKTCVFGSVGCTNYLVFPDNTESSVAGGNNRPYPALVSMDFNDQGTTGTAGGIGSMTTLNATVQLNATDQVQMQNVRFHRISLDLGTEPHGETFSTTTTFGNPLPKLYMFIDSNNQQFVMQKIVYPPTIQQFTIGSDANPAVANKRLVWAPGKQQSGTAGVVTSSISARTSGTLNCNGTKVLQASGVNILSVFGTGISLLPVCSSG
jgi:hypothetical protein